MNRLKILGSYLHWPSNPLAKGSSTSLSLISWKVAHILPVLLNIALAHCIPHQSSSRLLGLSCSCSCDNELSFPSSVFSNPSEILPIRSYITWPILTVWKNLTTLFRGSWSVPLLLIHSDLSSKVLKSSRMDLKLTSRIPSRNLKPMYLYYRSFLRFIEKADSIKLFIETTIIKSSKSIQI